MNRFDLQEYALKKVVWGASMKKTVRIMNEVGESLTLALLVDNDREVGKLIIDGVPYHMERMKAAALKRNYRVDRDTGYTPQHDKNGFCIIIAPYSEK